MPAKNLKRSLRRIRKKQQGGDGQGNQGHDVSMPIQYFGKELNRYYEANSPDLLPPSSAYGPTVATSHGVSIPGNDTAVGPDLGPFHKDIGHSGLQTGGGSKKNQRKNRKQKGGDGQGNQGHDVSMPIQYFGGKLDRYFPEGSPQLVAPDSAYGPTIATSHGVSIPGNSEFVGPDLGPFNAGLGISGLQTGGGKRKNKRKSIKKGGERLNLRAPNMDDGAPFHPQWGGNKEEQQKKKSSKKKRQLQKKLSKKQKNLSQKKKKLQKLQEQVKELEKEIKQTGGDKLNLRCANMDCGPPFHPQWAGAMVTDEEQDGGAMVTDEEQDGGAMVTDEEQDGGAKVTDEEVQTGGGNQLETFKKNFNITQKIIDLNFNDENELILKSEVPIITFETFKNYYGGEEHGVEEASIRNMFNNSSIDRKLEMCNSRFNELTD